MDISIFMVRALIDALGHRGVEKERLLSAAGLEPSSIDDPSARLTLAEYDRVQRAALEVSGDPALGLHLGDSASPQSYALLGYMTAHATTLRDAIEVILRYSRLLSATPPSALIEEGEVAVVRFAFPRLDSPSVRLPSELACAGLARMLRAFAGPDARPRAVRFAYPAPAYRDEYARVFGGTERFDQPYTGVELDRSWLQREQLHKAPELYDALRNEAERWLGRLSREDDVVRGVLQALSELDPGGPMGMDAVAAKLGHSPRSLRRKLAAQGASYKALVERARALAARRMLQDPARTIQETAYAMGFASPAAFHRAFKRWTGKTPLEYRRTF